MNEGQAAYYLAGIIDGEGCVNLGKTTRNIEITNTDIDIINATKLCLKILKIGYRERQFQPKNLKHKFMYIIYITQRINLERTYMLVLLQSFKRKKLIEILESYKTEIRYNCKSLIKVEDLVI